MGITQLLELFLWQLHPGLALPCLVDFDLAAYARQHVGAWGQKRDEATVTKLQANVSVWDGLGFDYDHFSYGLMFVVKREGRVPPRFGELFAKLEIWSPGRVERTEGHTAAPRGSV